jgi:hypothetical protein
MQFSPRSVFLPFRSKFPPQDSVLRIPQSVSLLQSFIFSANTSPLLNVVVAFRVTIKMHNDNTVHLLWPNQNKVHQWLLHLPAYCGGIPFTLAFGSRWSKHYPMNCRLIVRAGASVLTEVHFLFNSNISNYLKRNFMYFCLCLLCFGCKELT